MLFLLPVLGVGHIELQRSLLLFTSKLNSLGSYSLLKTKLMDDLALLSCLHGRILWLSVCSISISGFVVIRK